MEQLALRNPQDRFFFRPHSLTKEADTRDSANHLTDDEDNHKDDDVTVSFDEQETSKTLLFVLQTQDQRYLLERCGNKLCLRDATNLQETVDASYKTTRYALPLFFVAVKTNVDCQPVGAFVTQDETTSSIREALEILKSWNPTWQPEVFFTDLTLTRDKRNRGHVSTCSFIIIIIVDVTARSTLVREMATLPTKCSWGMTQTYLVVRR